MLLNEIKKVFETDREALQGALNDLDFRNKDFSRDGQPGDVDPSLKDVLERSILTVEYSAPTKKDVEALTGTPEAREKTLKSLSGLAGTLKRLEEDFSGNLRSIKTEIGDSLGTGGIDELIQQTLTNLRSDSSSIKADRLEDTRAKFLEKRELLTQMLMKTTRAEKFRQETFADITKFLKSPEWQSKDGPTELRKRIERFYTAIAILKQNTANVAQQMSAAKSED